MSAGIASSKAVIDLSAYAHNLHLIREMVQHECGIIAVVKAEAYGHGAAPIARKAVSEGVTMLAVATVPEAVALREAGITERILVMVTPPDEALPAALEHGLRLALSDVTSAERVGELARRANKVAPIHCKIDTGMGRQGFDPDSAVGDLLHLTRVSHVDIEGIMTHFAVAEDPKDPFTATQIKIFKQTLRQLEKAGVPYEMVHAANSAAVVNHPMACSFDMVRPGLMTYGVWPTESQPNPCPLRPVLEWKTQVALVKYLSPGVSVGYGRTYVTANRMRAAVLPVGYADGYRWALSNRGEVLIRGTRCPVRGRVSMDQIVVDVTHLPNVSVGDTATLIGSDGDETITVTEMATWADTIPYDILTGLGRRVERAYVD